MTYRDVEPRQVKARRAAGEDLVLVDLREPHEVAEWAYPDAVNIPSGEIVERADELPRDRPVVLACHGGGRSSRAAAALAEAGWTNLENLRGGQVAWAADDQQ